VSVVAPPETPRILVVDDDDAVREVISVLLNEEGYSCLVAQSADEALGLAAAGETHLVISDMKMPLHDGLWLLDQLRKKHPDTAVIMLTGYGDTEAAVECLRRGAVDYLLKPPKLTNLVRSIERALAKRRIELARRRYHSRLEKRVKEKTAELSRALTDVEGAYGNTLLALVAALDAREHETGDHSQRVVRYTVAIAQRMGIRGPALADIARGALMHDIGKIGVPDAILLKPGPLTPAEWEEMRRHPDIGFNILKGISFLDVTAQIVLSHQERFDGRGYPRKMNGQEIHIGARIFMVADTLDAITSDRPYRRSQPFEAARQEIGRCGGSQFDSEVVRAFLDIDVPSLMELRRRVQPLAAVANGHGAAEEPSTTAHEPGEDAGDLMLATLGKESGQVG
jgi:response regulator RpfG family c-di-GMP phosphodiesterase